MSETRRRRPARPQSEPDAGTTPEAEAPASRAVLRISSRNYSSWSLRGWLILRLSGLSFETQLVSPEDPATRAELLLQSSSILLPCLLHDGAELWDTLAIAEYLNEQLPEAGLLPEERLARARCRAICGEMHAGFHALRSSLPMNLRAHVPGFTVWSAARADLERIFSIWRGCLEGWGGPWLFGTRPTIADAMYAPVVLRCRSYDVSLDASCEAYAQTILGWPDIQEWIAAARQEPEARITELEFDSEF
ncbi:glutathione S-transferase [Belnapia rosea]|uniref:Glutathione S-transferase n=1 Tax=Belnapia rosea TaxID=938405 RepID=A0A1G6NTZ4_9PROT|nr:glutathione S-transferase [Belnapia rosea]SDC71238.1 glutathione S-transferase [Belnapia rosea]